MKQFFFDTANIEYIEKTWDRISKYFDKSDVVGVTTNPNAMYKENLNTIEEWAERTTLLVEFVRSLNTTGRVYIQGPNSNMSVPDIKKFLSYFEDINQKYPRAIGIKIPPYHAVLALSHELMEYFPNVTGVADCGTALNAMTFPAIKYVSIIPGRMEEHHLPAKAHVSYVQQRYKLLLNKIITGSMRTVEGLKWVIEYGTVPTIGTRVWDQLLADEDSIKEFSEFWDFKIDIPFQQFSPQITELNTQLSIDFFNQMDEVGKLPHADFLSK